MISDALKRSITVKRKILMLLMAGLLSFSMMAGCGNTAEPTAEVQEDEEEEDRKVPDEDEEVKPADEQVTEPVTEPEPEEKKELDMPRSDAYEMFLAGEMDVTVYEDPTILMQSI